MKNFIMAFGIILLSGTSAFAECETVTDWTNYITSFPTFTSFPDIKFSGKVHSYETSYPLFTVVFSEIQLTDGTVPVLSETCLKLRFYTSSDQYVLASIAQLPKMLGMSMALNYSLTGNLHTSYVTGYPYTYNYIHLNPINTGIKK